eukprot:COSAG02_NODE_291_length_25510_cov_9.433828_13_plen_73_part_00
MLAARAAARSGCMLRSSTRVGMWELSEEQASALDSFEWLTDIDRTLRGCATRQGGDGQASADTECRNVLAVA